MNFHDHVLIFDWMKRTDPRMARMGIEAFYQSQMADSALAASTHRAHRHAIAAYNQSQTEWFWHKNGRPYYKIYPSLLPMFMDTKLDVPGKYLHSPFSNFLIRLPQGHGCTELIVEGRELQTVFVTEVTAAETIELREPIEHSHMFIVWMNFGEVYNEMPYYIYQVMKFRPDESIESAVSRQRIGDKVDEETLSIGIDISSENINNCIRLVVSTCFLATGADKIVEPDILTKDLQRYIDACRAENPERIEQLHGRAKRRGKHGWTVGREIRIPTAATPHEGDGESGQSLTYQHQRGAHFHVFRFGPGRSKWRVKWIRQLTVRPDLPLPLVQTKKGYVAK